MKMYNVKYGWLDSKTKQGRERIQQIKHFMLGKNYYAQTQITSQYHTVDPKLMADLNVKHLGSTI